MHLIYNWLKPRLKAFALASLFSVLSFSVLLFVVVQYWFPGPYFTASGGYQGLILIALAHFILGPVLVLVISNPLKERKKLVGDLIVILLLQMGNLAIGGILLYQQRPVAIAFFETRFYVVTAKELNSYEISSLSQYGSHLPVMVYVHPPKSVDEITSFVEILDTKALPPYAHTHQYAPYRNFISEISDKQIDINEITRVNERMEQDYTQLMTNADNDAPTNFFSAIVSKYHNLLVLMDSTGEVLGYIDAPQK